VALEDYEKDMMRCPRCSECKWIPGGKIQSWRFAGVCPSIGRYNFHAYSAGGKLMMGLAMLNDKIGYTDDFLDIIYRCNVCGACDVLCKYTKDMEPLAVIHELRAKAVEDGELLPQHMIVIDGLRKEDNMMQRLKADRGKWAEGLDVKDVTKEKAEVYYHAGCRYSFDEELWPIARDAVNLLKKAGVDVGIAGKEETCCGTRAYEMGYEGELTKYAQNNMEMLKTAGIKTLVTSCADCYQGFKVLYDKLGLKGDLEVLHITEYLDRLIKEGKLKLTKSVPMTVTYHDPCHLGRLGEPYTPWEGVEKKVLNKVYIYDPPKPWRRGTNGVYDAPRDVLRSIPGLELVEMERIKEYAWCCGAGGGVREAYPDFAMWTTLERIEEAKATGAEAMVTACPWCERNFNDALKETGDGFKIYDIVELVKRAV
jgi:Fe-S oxidoreductase